MKNDIVQLPYKYDVGKLKESLDWLLSVADINRIDQLCLTHAPKHKKHPDDYYYQGSGSLSYEYYATVDGVRRRVRDEPLTDLDFTDFIDKAKHTYFYTIYKQLCKDFKVGRMRIMLLDVNKCLSWHKDPQKRIHIPVVTNPGCKMIIEDNIYHMDAGSCYIANTMKKHTALNAGMERRYHILITLNDDLNDQVWKERNTKIWETDEFKYVTDFD